MFQQPRNDSYVAPTEEVNFLEALAGLILAPYETTSLLFQSRNPPYGWTLFACLLCSVYVPFFAQSYKYGYPVTSSGVVVGLTLFFFFTLLTFLILEGIFLQVLQVTFNMQMLFSCVAFALTPMILCLWLIYGFNYLSEGRLTIFTFLLTGFGSLEDRFLMIVPYAAGICLLWMAVVFLYSVKHMARLSFAVALTTTLLSLIPLGAAMVFGLLAANLARPGTLEMFNSLTEMPVFSSSY